MVEVSWEALGLYIPVTYLYFYTQFSPLSPDLLSQADLLGSRAVA